MLLVMVYGNDDHYHIKTTRRQMKRMMENQLKISGAGLLIGFCINELKGHAVLVNLGWKVVCMGISYYLQLRFS